MKKYQTGLVIGRFQPFHNGHLFLLHKSLEICDEVVIAIGSANVTNEANPLSFEVRRDLLQHVIQHENFQHKIRQIVPSFDFPSDEEWARELFKNVGKFDVGIGNNEWTNKVLEQAGYPAVEIELLDRENFQGTHIRELIKTGQQWQHLVPAYLIAEISRHFINY